MKNYIAFILIGSIFTQCTIDRTILNLNQDEIETLKVFESLESSNKVRISDENEAGQKLWLCLTFISKENKEPLNNEQVKLYHTSDIGEYEPTDPNDESTARLSGTVITDEKGRIFVQTILPGDYGSSADNRHIHTTVNNAKPEAYDINFKQYTGQMGNSFIDESDQHFLADLKQKKDSTLVTFLTIEVKNIQTKNKK